MRLVYKDQRCHSVDDEVTIGDSVQVEGEDGLWTVISFPRPTSPASSGKVTVRHGDVERTLYVSLIGAGWIEREDQGYMMSNREDLLPMQFAIGQLYVTRNGLATLRHTEQSSSEMLRFDAVRVAPDREGETFYCTGASHRFRDGRIFRGRDDDQDILPIAVAEPEYQQGTPPAPGVYRVMVRPSLNPGCASTSFARWGQALSAWDDQDLQWHSCENNYVSAEQSGIRSFDCYTDRFLGWFGPVDSAGNLILQEPAAPPALPEGCTAPNATPPNPGVYEVFIRRRYPRRLGSVQPTEPLRHYSYWTGSQWNLTAGDPVSAGRHTDSDDSERSSDCYDPEYMLGWRGPVDSAGYLIPQESESMVQELERSADEQLGLPPFRRPVTLIEGNAVVADDAELVCVLDSATPEEAEFIVRAVNAYAG